MPADKSPRRRTNTYLEALLAKVRPHVHPFIWDELHRAARATAGGAARAELLRQLREATPEAAPAGVPAEIAQAVTLAKAEANADPGDNPLGDFTDTDLAVMDPDIAGAIFEVMEALGAVGDADEKQPDLIAAVAKMPPDIVGAFAELAEACGADTTNLEFAKGAPDSSDVGAGNALVVDITKAHPPVHTMTSDTECALCGKGDTHEIHQGHGGVMAFAKAEWSTSYINDLPDSSFAYIAPGGQKDGDGKTTPRSLRFYPFKDAQGNVDLPHLRNALARAAQQGDGSDDAAKAARAALPRLQAAAKDAGIGQFAKAEFEEPGPVWLEKAESRADGLDVVYGVVLHPGGRDSHGHRVSERDITVAAHRFLGKLQTQANFAKGALNLQHARDRQPDAIPVESFVAPQDLNFEADGRQVKVMKGSWIVGNKVSKAFRKEIEDGLWTGLSLEGDGFELPAAAFSG